MYSEAEYNPLECIEIIDNGIGFNDECYSRFKLFYDQSKGKNNKGSGRVQYLSRFGIVYFESVYEVDRKYFCRKFEYGKKYINNQFIKEISNEENAAKKSSTKVVFKEFLDKKENEFYTKIKLKEWKQCVLSQYLLKLAFIKEPFNIVFNLLVNDGCKDTVTLTNQDLPPSVNDMSVEVPYLKKEIEKDNKIKWVESSNHEIINIKTFQIPIDSYHKNESAYFSKNIKVASFSFPQIKRNTVLDGCYNITGIFGDYLDDERNVDSGRTSFRIPTKSEYEKKLSGGDDLFLGSQGRILFL